MKRFLALGCAAFGICLATPAAAQISAEGNVAKLDGDWGGEIGLGYDAPLVPGLVDFSIGGGTFIHDGQDDTEVDLYARAEAKASVADTFALGAGARFGGDLDFYGTVEVPLSPLLKLKGNVGADYFAAGLRFGF
ncbi:hypothetical protein [Stakelama tenebrarum]|uniref:Outer membrane protein beta-barrel domain-containing protein n=1 Tax=Stakelama tenebrarum TaxID=2711215 RepID=A0A6G6Y8R1_9SPHN|nr:hypothetical protein [Sphingosinithalassobacter tenebrarum]QIG81324.1 hypothetical protein G5C33_17075 [Sphingosinithalassobacter tenebrarum]